MEVGIEEVHAELARILASDQFKRSSRLAGFLTFVVDNALQEKYEHLKEYVLGVEVYGKGSDFDPRIDSTVRVEAARLRSKLLEYYEAHGRENPIRIDLPKGGYVPHFRRIESAAGRPTGQPAARHSYLLLALLISGLLLSGLIVALIVKTNRGSPATSVTVIPLTNWPGPEEQPYFSPDGKQVAFAWDGPGEDNTDVYVKPIGDGNPRRLTFDGARDDSPAWSPDGHYIAFFRHPPSHAGFYLVHAQGGPERFLAVAYSDRLPGRFLDWFPDSKTLAVVDKAKAGEPFSLFSLSVDTGERRRLSWPPAGSHGDRYPALSSDGRLLAFARSHAFPVADVYVTDLATGQARRLTFDNQVISGLAWSADDGSIVFSSERGSTAGAGGLWRVPVSTSRGGPAVAQQLLGPGPRASLPAVARRRGLLAYQESRADTNIRRASNPGCGSPSATAALISSTREEAWPRYSPDGRHIAFQSNRSGNWEIWVANEDGSDPIQVTALAGAPARYPSWSPDGRFLAFDFRGVGNGDIYTIAVNKSPPGSGTSTRAVRVTTDGAADETPSWSADGPWIYFSSNRSGDYEVWRAPVTSDGKPTGEPIRLTHGGGAWPAEGPGGFVYFIRGPRQAPELWKVPGQGGRETLHIRLLPASRLSWAVTESGVFFIAPSLSAGWGIRRFAFATGQEDGICELGGRSVRQHLAISPNGRWFIYQSLDGGGSDIMLAENFR